MALLDPGFSIGCVKTAQITNAEKENIFEMMRIGFLTSGGEF
jgi:hypothetical protein